MATSNLIIPSIGTEGYYSFLAPFDSFTSSGQVYTCKAVRQIGDIIASNEDPYTVYYAPYGLTQDDFKADLAANMYIVSLQSDQGQWVYVPARYIKSYPKVDGVAYQTVAFSVQSGPVPVSMDLSAIKTALSNVIVDMLGVIPNIAVVQTSKTTIVSQADSQLIEKSRAQRAINNKTDRARYMAAETLVASQAALIQQLENYILANMPPK